MQYPAVTYSYMISLHKQPGRYSLCSKTKHCDPEWRGGPGALRNGIIPGLPYMRGYATRSLLFSTTMRHYR